MTDTDLDVTLTLAEYVRRMNSADAAEWLPTPSETVVLFQSWAGMFRLKKIESRNSRNTGYLVQYEGGHWIVCQDDDLLTVSLLTY